MNLHKRIEEIAAECSLPGWACEEEDAITFSTVVVAKEFLDNLPSGIPAPDICPERDGSFEFEWYAGKGRCVIVSINSDQKRCCWIWSTDDDSGSGTIEGNRLPDQAKARIQELFHQ